MVLCGIRNVIICEEMENMCSRRKNKSSTKSKWKMHKRETSCFLLLPCANYFPSLFTRGKGFTPYLVFSQCSNGNNESTRHSKGGELLWPSWIKLQRASPLQAAVPLMEGCRFSQTPFLWRFRSQFLSSLSRKIAELRILINVSLI